MKKLKIFSGKVEKGLNLILGNCAKEYSELDLFIGGCPPLTGQAKNALNNLYKVTCN
jgi:coenzyme F420-reducing hydrogenase gamma subunit